MVTGAVGDNPPGGRGGDAPSVDYGAGAEVRLIVTAGHLVGMAPAVAAIEPLLTYETWSIAPDGRGGLRRAAREVAHYDIDHRGRLVFVVGMLPTVRAALEGLGYRVTIDDRGTPCRRLRPAPGVIGGAV